MRVGVIGSGHWADTVHCQGAQLAPEADFVGIWARDGDAARRLAKRHATTAFTHLDDLLDAVDAVSVAVAPDAQPEIARRAAEAGCRLLLEKPVALDPVDAEHLRRSVEASRVPCLVFFTFGYGASTREWITTASQRGGWTSGTACWLLSNYGASSPYRDSAWRKRKGPLWDLSPHVLSVFQELLGPIEDVSAQQDPLGGDAVSLRISHASGSRSTARLSTTMPPEAVECAFFVSEGEKTAHMPALSSAEQVAAHARALAQLSRSSPEDSWADPFGLDVAVQITRMIADAEKGLR